MCMTRNVNQHYYKGDHVTRNNMLYGKATCIFEHHLQHGHTPPKEEKYISQERGGKMKKEKENKEEEDMEKSKDKKKGYDNNRKKKENATCK